MKRFLGLGLLMVCFTSSCTEDPPRGAVSPAEAPPPVARGTQSAPDAASPEAAAGGAEKEDPEAPEEPAVAEEVEAETPSPPEAPGEAAPAETDHAPDPPDPPGLEPALEEAIGEVRALAESGEFAEAFDRARRLRREHGGIQEVESLFMAMREARARAVKVSYTVRQLGSESSGAREVARRKLYELEDAAVFLRKALRDGAAEGSGEKARRIAAEAARLLGALGDERSAPLLTRLLVEGAEPPLRAALVEGLAGAAPEPRPELLTRLYPLVDTPAGEAPRDLLDYFAGITLPVAGTDPEAWARLYGDPAAYETLRVHVEAAQRSGDPERMAWAERHARDFDLLVKGLKASFFKGTDFEEPIAERLVSRVDYDHRHKEISGIPQGNISARFTGKLRVMEPGAYRIIGSVDDGVRIRVNGREVVSEWRGGGEREIAGTIRLEPGLHDLEMEWYQGPGGYAVRLRWEGPGIEKTLIPTEHLRALPWPGMEAE